MYTALSSEDVLMTSISDCKKTFLSRNWCIIDQNVNGTQLKNHCWPFGIRDWKLRKAPPIGYSTMTLSRVNEKTSLSLQRCMMEMIFLLISYRKVLSHFQNPSLKNCIQRSLGELSWRRLSDSQTNFIFSNVERDWGEGNVEHKLVVGIQTDLWPLSRAQMS